MVTGEAGSVETTALDNNAENLNTVLDKYISKPSRAKDRVPSEAPRPPQLPSYLRTTSRASVRGTERRRRGGEYALSPSPRPSYAGHEELRPRPRHMSAPPPRYKLPATPPPRPRKLPRDPSVPRVLPNTPKVEKKSYIRYKSVKISSK